jgi:hypothetical protein
MAVPDSSPRASAGVSVRIPQMLTLADGTLFPPNCCAIPWGRASGPAGLAPEALHERGCSCEVFSQSPPVCEVLVSAGIDNIPAGLGGAMRTYLAHVCVRCTSIRCSHASSPRAWARSKAIGACSLTCLYVPSSSLRGTKGEVSATPIERVANCGFLVELLSGDSSGRPCLVR